MVFVFFGLIIVLMIVGSLYVYRQQKKVLSEEERRENEGLERVRKERVQSAGADKR